MSVNRILGVVLMGLGLATYAQAQDDVPAGVKEECAQLPAVTQQADKWYRAGQFHKAAEAYQKQAGLMAFCLANIDDGSDDAAQTKRLNVAYNNVGLSHAKQGDYRWARAWYELHADVAPSPFNLQHLPAIKPSGDKRGQYVRYAGQGQWNYLTIRDGNKGYDIDFEGLRMGLMGWLYGPNMGNFSTRMAKNSQTAHYRYDENGAEPCDISMTFLPANAQGERIKVEQKGNSSCGFGHGVYADGTYLKISDSVPKERPETY